MKQMDKQKHLNPKFSEGLEPLYKFIKEHVDLGSEGSAVRILDDEHKNLTIVDELNHLMTESEKEPVVEDRPTE